MPNPLDERYLDFQDRIGVSDEKGIMRTVCGDFNLGTYVSSSLIMQGYEDYNAKLISSKGSYLVKVFSHFRSPRECKRIVEIITHVGNSGVNTPKLLRGRHGYLDVLMVGRKRVRLCVMDFIKGMNLFKLGTRPDAMQIRFLAKQAALINSLKLHPFHLYDSWAIFALPKAYAEKQKYLPANDKKLVFPIARLLKKVKMSKLPCAFVHGDLLGMNVIKDKKGRLWIIDFSVANYYPRITELAVFASDLLLDPKSKRNSDRNLKIALTEYQKKLPLTTYELEVLPIFIRAQHAMHLINPLYYKIKFKTDTEENEHMLSQSRIGLKQMSK